LAISAIHSNSVLALRSRELAKALRPFRARGSKVIRCQACLLPAVHCLCAERPEPSSTSAFCFLMYTGEAFKPSNTGRLIADIAHDNYAFLWDRTRPDPAFLSLLNDKHYSPIVVFPGQYAEEKRCITIPSAAPGVSRGKKPLFIMLDGTWREAKKMFKSPCLADFPVLGIDSEHASAYRLREAAHHYQLCTAEVGIAILRLNGEQAAADIMQTYFAAFRRLYIAGKPAMLERYGNGEALQSG
jgi:DTW domain-containing protein